MDFSVFTSLTSMQVKVDRCIKYNLLVSLKVNLNFFTSDYDALTSTKPRHKQYGGLLTGLSLVLAVVGPPGVVATLGDSAVLACEHQAVGAVVELRLAVHALPVPVTVGRVWNHSTLDLAGVLLVYRLLTTHCNNRKTD